MATILNSEVEIYAGLNVSSSAKVGNTITTSGATTAINVNGSTLGVSLNPGTQYSARARCTNSDQYTSDWTTLRGFKTLVSANYLSSSTTANSITVYGSLSYTDVTPTKIGVYYSTSPTGVGAQSVFVDAQYVQDGITITGLQEHTTYYVIMAAKDAEGAGGTEREWKDDWTNHEQLSTTYSQATLDSLELSSTYESILGDFDVTSTTPITAIAAEVQAVGGGETYHLDLDPSMTENSFTFTNGDDDSEGNKIAISPSTEYNVTLIVTNSAGDTNFTRNITTKSQEHSTIAINSITNVTANSAVVNLTFGEDIHHTH